MSLTYDDELPVVVRGRQGGKTVAMLQQLAETPDAVLVVPDHGRRIEAERLARAHDLVVGPRVVTMDELRRGMVRGHRGVLVDDAQELVRHELGGLELIGLSVNGEMR